MTPVHLLKQNKLFKQAGVSRTAALTVIVE